eukprot:jgi/Galph1/2657/GphlegSOOS_G1288.1
MATPNVAWDDGVSVYDIAPNAENLYESVVVDREIDVGLVTGNFYQLDRARREGRGHPGGSDYRLIMFCASLSWKRYHMDDSTKSFLESLKKAAFLYVDLQQLEQTPPKGEKRNFEWAIRYMKAASESFGEEAEDPEAAFKDYYRSSSRLVERLCSILNIPTSQYIVVAFDEIGALENKSAKFYLSRHPVAGVEPYRDFFKIIRELYEQDNLFFLVVGKIRFIPLSPLDSSNIKEHLEKSPTRLPNIPLVSEFLCGTSLRVEKLADALLEYTGGVPGLLTRAVDFLLAYVKKRKEPLSKEECIELMENNHFEDFCTKPFESGLAIRNENTRQSLDILLMMALYHIPFTLKSRLPSRASVFDVATEMGFYRRHLDWNTCEVFIPKMFIRYFENLPNISRLGKQLLETLCTEPVDCFYHSKCRLFEGLVVMQLHRILSSNVGNGSFGQLFSQLSPIWRQMKCTMDSESSVCYMESIHHSEALSLSKCSHNSFESNEWKKIILESLEYEKIYITTNTVVPDILFKLHSVDFKSSLIVGVGCKGRWRSEGVSWSEII